MSFKKMGLPADILQAIEKIGFKTPTPVQAQVIPHLLKNKGNMVALAQTGTGKTAAFGLPILSMLKPEDKSPRALILSPTRELCVQIARDIKAFAACSPAVSIVAVYGGAAIQNQLRALDKGVQIIVATPGRMLDILRRKKADLSGIERVILDEADEMLNMGFQEDLEAILSEIPETANTLLFSATMPRQIARIAKKYMKNAKEITIGERNAGAENVVHECYIVNQRDRYLALKRIADYYPGMYAIVFCRTRMDTQSISDWLIRDGYNADALHGDLSQQQRDRVMEKFRSKSLQMLVATDVAARGLDVNDLTHVINYNLPDELGNYTHRSGRTGRAGKSGISVVIINMREKGKVHAIEKTIKKTFKYRDVPAGRDICKAQLFRLIERMKKVEIDDKQIGQYLPHIHAALEDMTKEEIIKRFVSLEFNTLLEYYSDSKDLPAGENLIQAHNNDFKKRDKRSDRSKKRDRSNRNSARSGSVRMFINLGGFDGFNPKKLTGMINHEGGHDINVGRIDVMKKYSFFEIAEKDVTTIRKSLSKVNYKGRDVRVEPVEDKNRSKRFKHAEHRNPKQKNESYKPRKSSKPNKTKK